EARASLRLLGSGTILREVMAAAELLAGDWQIASEVFSVTSFSELARDAREVERDNRLNPGTIDRVSHVARLLAGHAPVVAATDYVRAWPQLIAEYVDARYLTLGTDGFGRSDTRNALRRFFEVDRHQVVLTALQALVRDGRCERGMLTEAANRYGVAVPAAPPWQR
ncbi:MAG TPA: pyruvate dehydrogenase (acetyl-transferring), homodimeric type, partial [Albitalea sp.]|nr:pyruvate dehydrogenase (acetyl-transferring), homodimeric type [Albitalea sp.]